MSVSNCQGKLIPGLICKKTEIYGHHSCPKSRTSGGHDPRRLVDNPFSRSVYMYMLCSYTSNIYTDLCVTCMSSINKFIYIITCLTHQQGRSNFHVVFVNTITVCGTCTCTCIIGLKI